MKKSNIYIGVFVIVLLVAAVFLVHDQFQGSTGSSVTSTSTAQNVATSTVSASSTISAVTSTWQSYSNAKPPFSIKYPSDLVPSTSMIPTIPGPYLLDLQFPKDIYFSTVLKDEAYAIVTASSSCSTVEPGPIDHGPESISMNGIVFTQNEVSDVAAGNRYLTITYDTMAGGQCYRITFFDHGANGAGLYLSDPAAIQAADAVHDSELSKIEAAVMSMVGTFSTTSQ